ncbi:MAG: hypothetical protein IKP26_03980 [Clostridia bacterium]|nr:hypothetical protein [Clostridia bacterium]
MEVGKNKSGAAVKVLQYVSVLTAAGAYAIYVFKHENEYPWYDFLAPLLTLALFAGVLIAAMPRLVSLFSQGNEFDPAEARYGKRRGNFFLIVLGALALHVFTYLLGICVCGLCRGVESSKWFEYFSRIAWMKENTDAQHYINIAENWYQTTGNDRLLLVFFPMLPLLIRCFNLVLHDSYLSATLINTIATALASGMTYLTLLPVLGNKRSKAAAFIALLLPGAIFFNSPMTEPLFLLFSVCGFFFMQKRNYIMAGVFTALAGFTRSLGVLLAVPIAILGLAHVISLIRSKQKVGGTIAKLIIGLVISTMGTLAYLAINYSLHGDPFKFLEYQWNNWHQAACPFFDTPRYMISYIIYDMSRDPMRIFFMWIPELVVIIASLGLMLAKGRKLPFTYTVYFLCYFAVSVGCTWLLSSVRYLCAALPVIAAVAHSCDKKWKTAVIFSLTAVMYIFYMVLYMKRFAVY